MTNPIIFSNERTAALQEALKTFLEALDQYAIQQKLTESQIAILKQFVIDAYLEKRATYFLEQKISDLNAYLSNAVSTALSNQAELKENETLTKVFYYKNKYSLVTNEQY